jgi:hypothetical protein
VPTSRVNPLTRISLLVVALLAGVTVQSAPQVPVPVPVPVRTQTAVEKFGDLQGGLHRARDSGDAPSYLRSALDLHAFLHGSPASILQLMSAQIFSGTPTDALQSFEHYVGMGQANEATLNLKPFDALRALPQYQTLHHSMQANTARVSTAERVFSLGPAGLIPEDIDFDPASQLFYITSIRDREILAVDSTGHSTRFALSPDHWPLMALKLDAGRGILWATEVAIDGVAGVVAGDWGKSAVLQYDLHTGRLLHRIPVPTLAALGDMTLAANGDAIVSDGEHGGIYRVSRKTLRIQRLDGGDFISPQTAAVLPGGKQLLVPDYLRGVGLLDLDTKHVSWIPMGIHALSGIDGLYIAGRTLIATQNGTSPERVIRFELDPALGQVQSESIIERATESLGDPTHGVVVGHWFYYIANSGWDALDEHGNRIGTQPPTEAVIMRAAI